MNFIVEKTVENIVAKKKRIKMAEKMNVPLKKRHNYGKINGSVSSLNGTNAKRE